jgi:hypothetical protein
VSTGQTAPFYSASGLSPNRRYYWRIVARNSVGSTTGPLWSFTTGAAPPEDVVIYASDVPTSGLHGAWTTASDAASPNGVALGTPDQGIAVTEAPFPAPAHYMDMTFVASAGVPYRFWMRIRAAGNSKYNDSVWVQFSDAQANGGPAYPIGSASALLVNLATDSSAASLSGWGWSNGAYWLAQQTTLTFPSTGSHTIRIQTREDGYLIDQIVLSPGNYLTTPPGPASNDSTIVPKP